MKFVACELVRQKVSTVCKGLCAMSAFRARHDANLPPAWNDMLTFPVLQPATGIELVTAMIQAPADSARSRSTQACQGSSNLALFLMWSGKCTCNVSAPVYTAKLITHTCKGSRNDLH